MKMNRKIIAISLINCLLCGCASHDGTYSPGCIAFEGSNIELSGGRFTWERFTDQVIVDKNGNIVNQFPDYPMHGSYRIEEKTVYMTKSSGEEMEKMYLHCGGNRHLLLTSDQHKTWQETGNFADCVLTLGHADSN